VNLFSSPSKQAQSVANADEGITSTEMQQGEQYYNTAESNMRSALTGLPNPFAGASPSAWNYAVNPQNAAAFGQEGPSGTTSGQPTAGTNPFAPTQSAPPGQVRTTQPVARSNGAGQPI
jgi:hypothetical protein